jgi:hypothetical protein
MSSTQTQQIHHALRSAAATASFVISTTFLCSAVQWQQRYASYDTGNGKMGAGK